MTALETTFDRPIPQSPDAERAVLGAIIISNRAFPRVQPLLRPENFFKDAHRTIYAAMSQLAAEGQEIEDLTLRERLSQRGELEMVGGRRYLSSLLETVPDVANVERYAKIVHQKAEARAILTSCNAAMREVLDGAEAVDVATSLQFALSMIGAGEDRRSRGIGDTAAEVRRRANELAREGRTSGIRTGIVSFDEMTGGYRRGNLSIIAARSSHGKTAWVMNTAVGALAADSSVRVAAYSLEMTAEAMVNVLRSRGTSIPIPRLQDWRDLPQYDVDAVIEYDETLMVLNDRFFFNENLHNIDDICADARRLKMEYGLDLVVVDYLQLVTGYDNEKVRERVVNQIGERLFRLAKELDVASVAPAQVTRQGHDRLSIDDLRESKALGHHAFLVAMLNRPWQAHKDRGLNMECETTLQIEKNRGGRTGDLRVHFDGATQTFTDGDCPPDCRYRRAAERG